LKKTVIIGFGYIAEKHVQVLNSFNCKVVGIYTRTYANTIKQAKKLGIKTVFKTFDEIYDADFDFFTLAVSAENNEKILKKVIPFGKPILAEKPAAFGSEKVKKLIKMSKNHCSPIMIGVNRRFYSVFHKALDYLNTKDKKLNSIAIEAPERFSDINLPKFSNFVRKNWMYANPVHCIDLIRFFAGNVKELKTNSIPRKNFYNAIGQSDKNIQFSYLSDWKSLGSWSVTLYSDDTRIVFNPLEQGTIIEKNKKRTLTPSTFDLKYKPGFHEQLKYFLENPLKNKKIKWPASDLSDHLQTIDLVERIFKS